jgi:hypothetical protein
VCGVHVHVCDGGGDSGVWRRSVKVHRVPSPVVETRGGMCLDVWTRAQQALIGISATHVLHKRDAGVGKQGHNIAHAGNHKGVCDETRSGPL